jgi:hypothetical protein
MPWMPEVFTAPHSRSEAYANATLSWRTWPPVPPPARSRRSC